MSSPAAPYGRTVYLTDELVALLTTQFARVDQCSRCLGQIVPWVFSHLRGRRAVRALERAGVARSVATRITGHRTESVYRRYAIVSDADLREAALKLDGHNSGHTRPPAVDSRSASVQNP